jgi:hypothetical protein
MYYKIEKSGCCERKGMIQIRFSFYLDKEDYGYEKHCIDIPERELTEEEINNPELAKNVKTIKRNNPFHNHFVYLDPTITDKKIEDIGNGLLSEAYEFWKRDEFPSIKNRPYTQPQITNKRKSDCKNRVLEIINKYK